MRRFHGLLGWASLVAAVAAPATIAPMTSQAQTATCITGSLDQTASQPRLSGVNNCGREMHFNVCAVSKATPPQRLAKTLKAGEAWSLELKGASGALPAWRSEYCRVKPGSSSADCPVECPTAGKSAGRSAVQTWASRPTPEDMARYYPDRAARMEVSGTAVLSCLLNDMGRPASCTVIEENPADYGFGDAALKLSRFFRATKFTPEGEPVGGTTAVLPVVFQAG